MKKLLSITGLILISLSQVVNGQKYGTWREDSATINPRNNLFIEFDTRNVGILKQMDENNWKFFPAINHRTREIKTYIRVFIPPANLFSDCIFLDPSERFFPLNLKGEIGEGNKPYTDTYYNCTSFSSLRFYLDTTQLKTDYFQSLVTDNLESSAISGYYQPFYFKKSEVTNSEYREFLSWVVDSIARVKLGYVQLNGLLDRKRKIDWSDSITKSKTELFLPQNERFYRHDEMDSKKCVYKFENVPSEYGKSEIEIYPDTLSWEHDFTYAYNEPMTNYYFWHPAYNNYPVVGVNYWQCLAFLEWKSKQLEQGINKKGKHYKIECRLPKESEWDMASTSITVKGKTSILGKYYFQWCDNSWMTDLELSSDVANNTIIHNAKPDSTSSIHESKDIYGIYNPQVWSPYRKMILGNEKTFGDFIADGAFHTAPVSKENNKSSKNNENARYLAHFDEESGINYLDGNVSEWMQEDLDINWRPIFTKHLQLQNGPQYDQYLAVRTIENYYFKKLPLHGKLVRGSNWFDERYSDKYGKNTAGMNAKTFEDPNKSHCTVGFRYVIYVYPLE